MQMQDIVMGNKGWYITAKKALLDTGALVLLVHPPKAATLREHLMALSQRGGGFRNIFYMIRELRFHVLFFRAAATMDLGVAVRDLRGSLEVRMHGDISKDTMRSDECLVIPAARYRSDR